MDHITITSWEGIFYYYHEWEPRFRRYHP